ncbi:MAG TPA: hypothetical protein VFP80_05640 [Thermoanaerobaculia bacterium]|nr:hypothetical protein [Thermoanaerobaculia bacterium]
MADLKNGTLVQHTTLGIGKIVAVEANAVHVFFPDGDKRFAAKLRLPAALALLRTEGLERNTWLEGLSAFALDPKLGRYTLAARWLTHDEAVEQFLEVFPAAFEDPAYLAGKGGRAACWRAAHDRWAKLFGDGEGARLAAADDLAELVKRALRVEEAVESLHAPADEGAVKDALSRDEATRPFFAALFELLSVPSPGRARFEKLFAAARDLPVDPAQQWLVATLFPFVASPGRHVLLRPKIACEAAARLGCDLGEAASPNWATYAALRALSAQLLERLEPNGARDFVDVEAFLHVTATAKRRAARSAR